MSDARPALNISTVECEGTLRVVAEGEIDLCTVPLLDQAILAAEATDVATIVIDIEAVSFIDSAGLRALLEASARSRQDADRLRITRGTTQAQRLFALACVETQLPLTDL